jgi:hypothetical protein
MRANHSIARSQSQLPFNQVRGGPAYSAGRGLLPAQIVKIG